MSSHSSIEQRPPPQLLAAPVPFSRRHVQFAATIEAPACPPRIMPIANVAASPSSPLLVAHCPDVVDVSMTLGGSRNSNSCGLGDCKHASPCISESSLPSAFTLLPQTASSVTVDMMDVLSDIAAGRCSPLVDSSTSSIEDIPTRCFHFEGATD